MENYNYEDSGNKFQNELLDEGEREAFHNENDENEGNNENYHHEGEEQQMDEENHQFYQGNTYKNLQRNNEYKYKNEYEVVNVENQGEIDDEQKYDNSDENMEKSPDSKHFFL